MKFFFKDFVMSSGRFNLPLQQTLYYKNKTEMPKFEHFLGFE